VAIWDTEQWAVTHEINVGLALRSADYNSVDGRIAVGSTQGVQVFDVQQATVTACEARDLLGARGSDVVAFLPSGHELPQC
jgi:hypothetical protein